MSESALVSVIITNYNYAAYVGFAITSAIRQTYPNIEILIVDDGSTDNSRQILSTWAQRDSRIRVFYQKNSGQAAATNRGIMEARGEFVAFLDADDVWYSEKLGRQIPLFADPEVGVVYSAARLIDLDGVDYGVRPTRRISKAKSFLHEIILENFIPFTSAIVRKECFLKAGLLNSQYRVCTDYDLWLRMAKFYKFDCVEECLIGYRARPDSLSGNPSEMLRVAREITEVFYLQNPQSFQKNFIRMERIAAYSNRVETFSQAGLVSSASYSLLRLFLLSPFSFHFIKSSAHFLLLLTRILVGKTTTQRAL
jgi:glycosyltransferase involved in cell wall biosynthesis